MSIWTDAQEDATSIDGFANTNNGAVPTRYGGNKPSYQYLVDQWNAQIAAAILELNKSRGFRVVGAFADGFTYELYNDVGIDSNGDSWIYTDFDGTPVNVTAGTVPSSPEYTQVTYNDVSAIVNVSQPNQFDDYYDRKANDITSLSDTQILSAATTLSTIKVISFWADKNIGGGIFKYDSSKPKSEHDGGNIIDPDKLSELSGVGVFGNYFVADGVGNGCWVRQGEISHCPTCFGALPDYSIMLDAGTDNTKPMKACSNTGKIETDVSGTFLIPDSVEVSNNLAIIGFNNAKFPTDSKVTQFWSNTDSYIFKTVSDKLDIYTDGIFYWGNNIIDVRPISIAQTGENKIRVGGNAAFGSDENDYGFAIHAGRSDFSVIGPANFYQFKGFCAVRFGGNINDSGTGTYSNSWLATGIEFLGTTFSKRCTIAISLEMLNSAALTNLDIGGASGGLGQERAIDIGGKVYNEQARLSSKYGVAGTFYNRAESENGGPNTFNFLGSDFIGSGRFNSVDIHGGHIEKDVGDKVVTVFGLFPNQFGRSFSSSFVDYQNTGSDDVQFIELDGVRIARTWMNNFDFGTSTGSSGVEYSNCTNPRLMMDTGWSSSGTTGDLYLDGGGNSNAVTLPSMLGAINTLTRPLLTGVDITDGTYLDPLRFGGRRLWVDNLTSFRTKNGTPGSATDGNAIAMKVPVPADATSVGKPGDYAVGGGFIYHYTGDGSTHTWVRVAAATW